MCVSGLRFGYVCVCLRQLFDSFTGPVDSFLKFQYYNNYFINVSNLGLFESNFDRCLFSVWPVVVMPISFLISRSVSAFSLLLPPAPPRWPPPRLYRRLLLLLLGHLLPLLRLLVLLSRWWWWFWWCQCGRSRLCVHCLAMWPGCWHTKHLRIWLFHEHKSR